MKPSERIEEIHRAIKVLDGQSPNEEMFDNKSFYEIAILKYLDELQNGTDIEKRKVKKL